MPFKLHFCILCIYRYNGVKCISGSSQYHINLGLFDFGAFYTVILKGVGDGFWLIFHCNFYCTAKFKLLCTLVKRLLLLWTFMSLMPCPHEHGCFQNRSFFYAVLERKLRSRFLETPVNLEI